MRRCSLREGAGMSGVRGDFVARPFSTPIRAGSTSNLCSWLSPPPACSIPHSPRGGSSSGATWLREYLQVSVIWYPEYGEGEVRNERRRIYGTRHAYVRHMQLSQLHVSCTCLWV